VGKLGGLIGIQDAAKKGSCLEEIERLKINREERRKNIENMRR
jgi:hypothetical protein